MGKRIKMPAAITSEQFNGALAALASCDAQVSKRVAMMDIAINKIRDTYSAELAELDALIQLHKDIIKTYAVENKQELFAERRHIDTPYGEVGFRLGTPAVKWLKDYNEDMVIEKLKADEQLAGYVRNIEEVDKQALIANRESEYLASVMEETGFKITQTETFFINLKKEVAAA